MSLCQEVKIDQYYVDCAESRRLCLECSTARECLRCKNIFCSHFASKIDFQFCQYCFSDLILEDSVIRKTYTMTSLTGKKTWTRVQKARLLVFKGEDWMFAQKRILDLSEHDIDLTIEYHRTILGELMNEKEARQIAKHKKALSKLVIGASGASLKIPTRNGSNTDGTSSASVITSTSVKKTKTIVPAAPALQAALQGVIAMLKAQGLSDTDIKAKLMAMAGGKK